MINRWISCCTGAVICRKSFMQSWNPFAETFMFSIYRKVTCSVVWVHTPVEGSLEEHRSQTFEVTQSWVVMKETSHSVVWKDCFTQKHFAHQAFNTWWVNVVCSLLVFRTGRSVHNDWSKFWMKNICSVIFMSVVNMKLIRKTGDREKEAAPQAPSDGITMSQSSFVVSVPLSLCYRVEFMFSGFCHCCSKLKGVEMILRNQCWPGAPHYVHWLCSLLSIPMYCIDSTIRVGFLFFLALSDV